LSFVRALETLHRNNPLDLIVIDALAALFPGYAETCAPKLIDCFVALATTGATRP
jgi:hypothetical protein